MGERGRFATPAQVEPRTPAISVQELLTAKLRCRLKSRGFLVCRVVFFLCFLSTYCTSARPAHVFWIPRGLETGFLLNKSKWAHLW